MLGEVSSWQNSWALLQRNPRWRPRWPPFLLPWAVCCVCQWWWAQTSRSRRGTRTRAPGAWMEGQGTHGASCRPSCCQSVVIGRGFIILQSLAFKENRRTIMQNGKLYFLFSYLHEVWISLNWVIDINHVIEFDDMITMLKTKNTNKKLMEQVERRTKNITHAKKQYIEHETILYPPFS